MSLILSGTDGLSDVDGSAATPAIRGTDTNTGMFFPAADTIAFAEGGTEVMRIDSSGNVGIGTSSPQARLQILDQLKVSNSAQSQGAVVLGDGGSTAFNVGIARWNGATNAAGAGGIGYFSQGSSNAGGHYWYTGDAAAGSTTERARIDTSGNFLVGTTSASTPVSGFTAEVSAGGAGVYTRINIGHSASAGINEAFSRFLFNSTVIGSIIRNGASSVAYNTSSDYRLKEDVQPMTGALAKVAALKPCTYKWKTDGTSGQGFIAHELAQVVPDAVSGEKDAVDAEGNPQYQGIDTSFLVATLTAAIQELKAELDSVKAEIAALKGAA